MNIRRRKNRWSIAALLVLGMVFCFFLLGLNIAQAEEKPKARPVVPGVDDKVTVRTMTVRLPAGAGWTKKVIPMPHGATLYEFERDLPNGNRLQIHVADYVGPAKVREYETMMKDKSDSERLAALINAIEATPMPDIRRSEWVKIARGPQRRYGAICKERHDLREEKVGGKLYLWQDWMLFCVDPMSHIPVQVDYAERYPAGGAPSPSFADNAARFYDSIEFR